MYINNMLMVTTSVVFSVLAMLAMNYIKNKMSVEVEALRLKVLFYTEAAYHGEHGKINVSNKTLQLQDEVVRFVFVGLTAPPKLDVSVLAHIWQEALAQGFIPHHIVEYGTINDLQVKTPIQPGANGGLGYKTETVYKTTTVDPRGLVTSQYTTDEPTDQPGTKWNIQEYPTANGKLEIATKDEPRAVDTASEKHAEIMQEVNKLLKGVPHTLEEAPLPSSLVSVTPTVKT